MGMFDYIECKMPLPEHPPPPTVQLFQTKFSDWPQLERYVIGADGRLIKLGYTIEDRSDFALGIGTDRLAGCASYVFDPKLDQVIDFHGDILFGLYDDTTGEDWDYVARFTEGVCTRIWCDEYHPPKA